MSPSRDDPTEPGDDQLKIGKFHSLSPAEEDELKRFQKERPGASLTAVRHFRLVIGPESDLVTDWQEYTQREKNMLCAGVLREFRDFTYEKLADYLKEQPSVASAAGFDDDPPTYSVLSRAIKDFDNEMLTTAAEWVRNAVQHHAMPSSKTDLSPDPGRPGSCTRTLHQSES